MTCPEGDIIYYGFKDSMNCLNWIYLFWTFFLPKGVGCSRNGMFLVISFGISICYVFYQFFYEISLFIERN